MALETLFKTEEKFPYLKFLQHIRRDPALGGPQVYLYDETNKDGKFCVSFVQALGDAARNQISLFPFLKPLEFRTNSCLPGCAVDERERLLYVLSGGGPKNISLKLIHLHYEAPDKFGYRRIVAVKERCLNVTNHLVCPNPPPFPLLPPSLQSLSICPVTGRLVTGYMVGGGRFAMPISNYQVTLFPADLVYNKNQRKAVVKAVTEDRLPLMTNLQSIQTQLNSPVFSRSNHLLFWLGFHQEYGLYNGIDGRAIQPTPDDDGCVILKSFIPGHPENGHLNQMKIDPIKLVKNLLPKSAFDNFLAKIPDAMPKHIFFGTHLRLLGHVHKYVAFCFHWNYILAVKWPREWYKLPEVPFSTRVSKVLRLDKERRWGQINDARLYETDLYLKSELGKAVIVRRMALGHKFKDYRRCASCGKEETGKKRNKEGKRMSRFKVCRMCKQLNLHILYSDSNKACHYCSEECQRKHWKRHKIIHKKEA